MKPSRMANAATTAGLLLTLLLVQGADAQQCRICGPEKEGAQCRPNKVMNIPKNITITSSMCNTIESTKYHKEDLCGEYPAPTGYFFQCVDATNSQFSCRSSCGPSLDSIGKGPAFDLLNNGNGLLLGKKNRGSIFDFSNFNKGNALDFNYGNLGKKGETNSASGGNANQSSSNSGSNQGASSASANNGGGNSNLFNKDLFGKGDLKNDFFQGGKPGFNNDIFHNSNNIENNNLNSNKNNNNENIFQFNSPQNPYGDRKNSINSIKNARAKQAKGGAPGSPFGSPFNRPGHGIASDTNNPFSSGGIQGRQPDPFRFRGQNNNQFGSPPISANQFGNPPPLVDKNNRFRPGYDTGFGGLTHKSPKDKDPSLGLNKKEEQPRKNPQSDKPVELGGDDVINIGSSKTRPHSGDRKELPNNSPSGPSPRRDNPRLGSGPRSGRSEVNDDPSKISLNVKPVITNYPIGQGGKNNEDRSPIDAQEFNRNNPPPPRGIPPPARENPPTQRGNPPPLRENPAPHRGNPPPPHTSVGSSTTYRPKDPPSIDDIPHSHGSPSDNHGPKKPLGPPPPGQGSVQGYPLSDRYTTPRAQTSNKEQADLNDLRSSFSNDGLKHKGVSAPKGLDGSRLNGKDGIEKNPGGYVGTSLLTDGDYLDQAEKDRAKPTDVPEEFEKPFQAEKNIFPGFEQFANGDGKTKFGTKDSVFDVFGKKNEPPQESQGSQKDKFNFNNPQFLQPDGQKGAGNRDTTSAPRYGDQDRGQDRGHGQTTSRRPFAPPSTNPIFQEPNSALSLFNKPIGALHEPLQKPQDRQGPGYPSEQRGDNTYNRPPPNGPPPGYRPPHPPNQHPAPGYPAQQPPPYGPGGRPPPYGSAPQVPPYGNRPPNAPYRGGPPPSGYGNAPPPKGYGNGPPPNGYRNTPPNAPHGRGQPPPYPNGGAPPYGNGPAPPQHYGGPPPYNSQGPYGRTSTPYPVPHGNGNYGGVPPGGQPPYPSGPGYGPPRGQPQRGQPPVYNPNNPNNQRPPYGGPQDYRGPPVPNNIPPNGVTHQRGPNPYHQGPPPNSNPAYRFPPPKPQQNPGYAPGPQNQNGYQGPPRRDVVIGPSQAGPPPPYRGNPTNGNSGNNPYPGQPPRGGGRPQYGPGGGPPNQLQGGHPSSGPGGPRPNGQPPSKFGEQPPPPQAALLGQGIFSNLPGIGQSAAKPSGSGSEISPYSQVDASPFSFLSPEQQSAKNSERKEPYNPRPPPFDFTGLPPREREQSRDGPRRGPGLRGQSPPGFEQRPPAPYGDRPGNLGLLRPGKPDQGHPSSLDAQSPHQSLSLVPTQGPSFAGQRPPSGERGPGPAPGRSLFNQGISPPHQGQPQLAPRRPGYDERGPGLDQNGPGRGGGPPFAQPQSPVRGPPFGPRGQQIDPRGIPIEDGPSRGPLLQNRGPPIPQREPSSSSPQFGPRGQPLDPRGAPVESGPSFGGPSSLFGQGQPASTLSQTQPEIGQGPSVQQLATSFDQEAAPVYGEPSPPNDQQGSLAFTRPAFGQFPAFGAEQPTGEAPSTASAGYPRQSGPSVNAPSQHSAPQGQNSEDLFNKRDGGYGFGDNFSSFGPDKFQETFTPSRFSDPQGYFGDSTFMTEEATQEDQA